MYMLAELALECETNVEKDGYRGRRQGSEVFSLYVYIVYMYKLIVYECMSVKCVCRSTL